MRPKKSRANNLIVLVACVAGGSSGECFCFGSEAANTSGGAVRGLVKSRVEFPPAQIRLCHTAAILSRETKKALFYHAEPRSQNRGGEAERGKTKAFLVSRDNMAAV